MANLEMRGTITEAVACTVYVDGDPMEGCDLTINQPGYEAFCAQAGFPYYPPRVRFTLHRVGGVIPDVGSKVIALVKAEARRGSKENADKTYVNLKGRSLAYEK